AMKRKRSATVEASQPVFSWSVDSTDVKVSSPEEAKLEVVNGEIGPRPRESDSIFSPQHLNATAAWLQKNSFHPQSQEKHQTPEKRTPLFSSSDVSSKGSIQAVKSSSKRPKIMPNNGYRPEDDSFPIPSSLVVFCGHFIRGCADSSATQLGSHPLTMPFTLVLHHNELISDVRARITRQLQEAIACHQNESQMGGDSMIPGSLLEMFGPNSTGKWRLIALPGPVPDMPHVNITGLLMTVSSSVVMHRNRVLSSEPNARIDLRDFFTPQMRKLLAQHQKSKSDKAMATSDSGLEDLSSASTPVVDLTGDSLSPMLASYMLAFSTRPWLGIEHRVLQKRPRYTFTEKPIKIFN
ncbi:hypothetical protein Ciccas_009590, partial [Cichlidogyrus casuarinus]